MTELLDPGTELLEAPAVLSREQMLVDLLSWCNSFVKRSSEWRQASFEDNWRLWQRNADGIYDQDMAAKKEKWQAKHFVPITPSHRENAQAQLFKTEVGPRPPLEVKARKGIVVPGMPDQSENIRDLILREREKSRYEIERNKVLEDKTTYGSGFARIRFETRIEDRLIRVPIYQVIDVYDAPAVMSAMDNGRPIVGYEFQVQPQVIYRGVVFEHISIWDVFPDPKALKIKGNPIAYRYETTYGDILNGVEEGYYLQEAIVKLKGQASHETTPTDKKIVETERKIADSNVERTDYGRKYICYEVQAKLPKKWVFINGEPIDDPEKLVPAIIRFHPDTIIGIEQNDSYDGKPNIYKDDYVPVAGQFYGRGIPEMLKDVQVIVNETVCQRLDTGSIALSQKFAIIEKAIYDQKDLDENRNTIRLKNPTGMNDIRQMMMRMDMGNVPTDAFVEPQEWERWAQERTSITRTTLGTAGQVKDANQTLGGMEMLKAASGEKMAFIGMLSEFDFQYEVTRAYWKLIYSNYNIEDVALAIGPERAATFQFLTPEQVENSYQYIPTGIYTMENKAMRVARLAQWDAQFGMMPWANRLELARIEAAGMDEDADRLIVQEADAIQITMKAEQMAVQMTQQALQQKEQMDLAEKAKTEAMGAKA